MNRIVKDGVDITDCEYVTQYGFCNDTLSGSCVRNKCQIFNLFSKIQKQQKVLKDIIPILDCHANSHVSCFVRKAQWALQKIEEIEND